MKIEGRLLFSVSPESEYRFVVSRDVIQHAFEEGKIKITNMIDIEQVWIISQKECSGRIRKTEDANISSEVKKPVSYEHTVKHHISKNTDYEVTTDLSESDYNLLKTLYKGKDAQQKIRLYVVDIDSKYTDYTITIDYPADKPKECWVEFESKNGKYEKGFEKPEWLTKKN